MGAGLRIVPVLGLPEIAPGDDLAALIHRQAEDELVAGAIVCIAQKLVSKSEGRVRDLATVTPGERAREFAAAGAADGDPRLAQVILDESAEVVRAERGILITRTHHGFVCANAGVDRSNVGAGGEERDGGQGGSGPERGGSSGERVVLLPSAPDASARALRARLQVLTGHPLGVLISDSFGRAWRLGQVDVAIGLAGIAPLDDHAGLADRAGRPLVATLPAGADELAAAASLARTKAGGQGAVIIHGAERHVIAGDGPGAAALLRALSEDLFR